MAWDFEDYYKNDWKSIETWKDTLKSLNELEWIVTSYIATKYDKNESEITSEVIEALLKVDTNLKELYNVYYESRFLPDVETLRRWLPNYNIDNLIQSHIDAISWKPKHIKTIEFNWELQVFSLRKNNNVYFIDVAQGEYWEKKYVAHFEKHPTLEQIEDVIFHFNYKKKWWESLEVSDISKADPEKVEEKYPRVIYWNNWDQIWMPSFYKWEVKWDFLNNYGGSHYMLAYIWNEEYITFFDFELSSDQENKVIDRFYEWRSWWESTKSGTVIIEESNDHLEWDDDYSKNRIMQLIEHKYLDDKSSEAKEAVYNMKERHTYIESIRDNGLFIKVVINLLRDSNNVVDNNIAKMFWRLYRFSSIEDFAQSEVVPEDVMLELNKLKSIENWNWLDIQEYIDTLIELSKINIVTEFFASFESKEARKEYRNKTMNKVEADESVNVWPNNFWLSLLSKEAFNSKPESDFDPEFKTAINGRYPDRKYPFEKPRTYAEFLNIVLTVYWPKWNNNKEGLNTVSIMERKLIDMWVFNITWLDLKEAITRMKSVSLLDLDNSDVERDKHEALIKKLYDDDTKITNTSRKLWKTIQTTIKELRDNRWDEYIMHTTVTKEYTFKSKDWWTISQSVVFDIFLRPDCSNLLIMPNSTSITNIVQNKDINMKVSMLDTVSVPLIVTQDMWDDLRGKNDWGWSTWDGYWNTEWSWWSANWDTWITENTGF